MSYVTRKDEGDQLVLRISKTRLRGVLDLPEPEYLRAVELLQAADLIRVHRRKVGPARGYLLPEDWEHEHAPHLARIARNLLTERGLAETPTQGRILRWD